MGAVQSERWQKIKDLHDAAIPLSRDDREALLDEACRNDSELRREVESLLAYENRAAHFMESPAYQVVAAELGRDEAEVGSSEGGTLVGQNVSHYHIIERLGAGGMGVVYKAEDSRLHRFVALKFLPEELARDSNALSRFRREAQAASALNHPHICTVYDICEEVDKAFIAMELLEGQSLRRMMSGRPFEIEQMLKIGVEVADALETAHQKGIIHRDIKPENIFINSRGDAKLLDFGLAKVQAHGTSSSDAATITDAKGVTQQGVAIGTVSYMSPEQAKGEPLDTRTDLFSLGLVLYEMATGRRAFAGATSAIIFASLLKEVPQSASELNPSVAPELERIIARALEKDRSLRYQKASEINADLRRVRESGPTRSSERRLSPRRKRSRVLALAAVAILAIAISTSILHWRRGGTSAQSNRTPIVLTEFENQTGDSWFDAALRDGVTVQLEQSPMLKVVPEDAITNALKKLGQPADATLTQDVGRQVCRVTGASAVVSAALASSQAGFVVTASATRCNGDPIAKAELQANTKDQVLPTLWKATADLRHGMGESLQSVQDDDVGADATTASMEAYRDYEKAAELHRQGELPGSVAFLKQAVEIDPNFATAYALMGHDYLAQHASDLRDQAFRTAFALRDHAGIRGRLWIEASYYGSVTGELFKEIDSLKRWENLWPNDFPPHNLQGIAFADIGDYQKSEAELRDTIRVGPDTPGAYANMGWCLLGADRFDDLRSMLAQTTAKGWLDHPALNQIQFELALVTDDAAMLAKELSWSHSTSSQMSGLEMRTEQQVVSGRKNDARMSMNSAAQTAARSNIKGSEAGMLLHEAWAEALWGYETEPRQTAQRAIEVCKSSGCTASAAQILAMAGDATRARQVLLDVAATRPDDTELNLILLPLSRSVLEYKAGRSEAALRAQDPLQPFDFGETAGVSAAYIRGLANLQLGRPGQAIKEFQSVIQHRGLGAVAPERVLAYVQLGRAYAAAHDIEKSKALYKRFFELWKDADPDIPILMQARAEFAKL
jgi:eukaryotic-like serine/threonine-protein kinase